MIQGSLFPEPPPPARKRAGVPKWLNQLITDRTLDAGRAIPQKCSGCRAWVLVGYSEGWRRQRDFLGWTVRADPYLLDDDGEVAAIILERTLWELDGYPTARFRRRFEAWQEPKPGAVVVAEHDCDLPPISTVPLPLPSGFDAVPCPWPWHPPGCCEPPY